MTIIERMQRYIELTPINERVHNRYDLLLQELLALSHMAANFDAITLAFDYGRAKGLREGRKEYRRLIRNKKILYKEE